jgi:Lon protease-like protein
MAAGANPEGVDELPAALPIFPLASVLLLPGGRLPLNVFEPRYRNMTVDALGGDRLIGIVQPRRPETASPAGSVGDREEVFDTGCAGRITEFAETDDGRFLIALSGLCRFRIAAELPMVRGYRRVRPDWSPFVGDLDDDIGEVAGKDRLLKALVDYAANKGLAGDWASVRGMPGQVLVTSLAMMVPLAAEEKQALLEAPDSDERARMLTQLMEMAIHERGPAGDHARPAPRH